MQIPRLKPIHLNFTQLNSAPAQAIDETIVRVGVGSCATEGKQHKNDVKNFIIKL